MADPAEPDRDNVDHAGQVFTTWRAHLTSLLFLDAGLARRGAESLAATTLASAEGAVAIARAE